MVFSHEGCHSLAELAQPVLTPSPTLGCPIYLCPAALVQNTCWLFPIPSPKSRTQVPLQPFQPLGTQQIPQGAPGPQGIPNTAEKGESAAQRAQKPSLPHPPGASSTTGVFQPLASALSLTPAVREQTSSSQEEEDGFNVLHERKIRGRRLTGRPEMAAGAMWPAAGTQQAGSHQC